MSAGSDKDNTSNAADGVDPSPTSSTSPTPWRVDLGTRGSGPWDRVTVETADGQFVVCTMNDLLAPANAAAIVRAVNCHDELLEALKLYRDAIEIMRDAPDDSDRYMAEDKFAKGDALARAAIAKATQPPAKAGEANQ